MVRPYWVGSGREKHGVPDRLAGGRHTSTRPNRLRHARKMGDRRTLQEELARLKPHQLSKPQKQAGARLIV